MSTDIDVKELINIAFLAWTSFSVFFMIQGAGLFYSGLSKRKSALAQAALSLVVVAIIQIQWFVWGYSLAFSRNSSKFIGTLEFAGLHNLLGNYEGAIHEVGNSLFQGMLACLTGALLVGSIADRARVVPMVIFLFIWSTIVYDPLACWTWNERGWAAKMGYLDYAGGTPVHLCAGMSALAYSWIVGKRSEEPVMYRPSSTIFVVIGTFLLWAGWFGFNSGANLTSSTRAMQALLNTQIAAAFGGFSWAIFDFRLDRKWSVVGFCSGVISGLVCITPAAGYVPAWSAPIFGVLGGVLCNLSTKIKFYLSIDDSLDVFAVHGVGAFVGNLLTGLFATQSIAGDGIGGWLDHNYVQLGYQVAATFAAAGYSFFVSLLLLWLIQLVPGLHLRISVEDEERGIDATQHDEHVFDYVELFPELPTDEYPSALTPEIMAPGELSPSALSKDLHFKGLYRSTLEEDGQHTDLEKTQHP